MMNNLPTYRAWKKTDGPEMFHDIAYINFNNNETVAHNPISSRTMRLDKEPLDNVILELGSGLPDINGVEVFQGDIVAVEDFSDDEFSSILYTEVRFDQGSFYFYGTYSTVWEDVLNGDKLSVEVIGNIHTGHK